MQPRAHVYIAVAPTPGPVVARWIELFEYDESSPSGLRWRVDRGRVKAGAAAGRPDHHGYYTVRVTGRWAAAHRIVFEMLVGEIPPGIQIDHINRDRGDNRIENLRLVTHRQNGRNRRDSADHVGVYRNGVGWCVQVSFADGVASKYFSDHALAVEQARVWHWLADVHPHADVAFALALAIGPARSARKIESLRRTGR